MKQVRFTRKKDKIVRIIVETTTDDYGSWAQYYYDEEGNQIQEPSHGTLFASVELLERSEAYHKKCQDALSKIKY